MHHKFAFVDETSKIDQRVKEAIIRAQSTSIIRQKFSKCVKLASGIVV